MKFPSEGEFWHCHFARNKMGASRQMFQANRGQTTRKCEKCDILCHLLYIAVLVFLMKCVKSAAFCSILHSKIMPDSLIKWPYGYLLWALGYQISQQHAFRWSQLPFFAFLRIFSNTLYIWTERKIFFWFSTLFNNTFCFLPAPFWPIITCRAFGRSTVLVSKEFNKRRILKIFMNMSTWFNSSVYASSCSKRQ